MCVRLEPSRRKKSIKLDNFRHFIELLYKVLLNSTPSQYKIFKLHKKTNEKKELGFVINDILSSDNFYKAFINLYSDRIVDNLYHALLARKPDQEGLAHHSSELRISKDLTKLLINFIKSNEFIENTKTAYYQNNDTNKELQRLKSHLDESTITAILASKKINETLKEKQIFLEKQNNGIAKLLFCYRTNEKKELDTLRPIFEHIKSKTSIPCDFVSLEEAIALNVINNNIQIINIVSIEICAAALIYSGSKNKIAYFEHGTSPIKSYTYGEHYKNYDYIFLPGSLWVDRLIKLYPELSARAFNSGFPKLISFNPTSEQRNSYCKRFNLNPEEPIVLFAPTWSQDANTDGIFYLNKLQSITNIIAIPHDGDRMHVQMLRQLTPATIHTLEDESISYHYGFADLLISDISSTSIEFALLGKPVVCIIDRLHFSLNKKIPLTEFEWDFCPLVPAENIKKTIADHFSGKSAITIRKDKLKNICSCYGTESNTEIVRILNKILKICL